MTKIPQRMCAICKAHKNKNDLHRFVIKEDKLVLDKEQKINARGLYICKDQTCINNLKKSKLLNRVFKKKVSDEDYDLLISQIED